MAVLRAVIDQQKNMRHRETFNQAIEKGLGFGVDPMQVSKDDDQRLPLSLTDEHPLYRVQSKTTSLLRVHRHVSFRRIDHILGLCQSCGQMNVLGQYPEQ